MKCRPRITFEAKYHDGSIDSVARISTWFDALAVPHRMEDHDGEWWLVVDHENAIAPVIVLPDHYVLHTPTGITPIRVAAGGSFRLDFEILE